MARAAESERWREFFRARVQKREDSPMDRAVYELLTLAGLGEDGGKVRRPSCSLKDDLYFITWAFDDVPKKTFSFEVDERGGVFWFFRNRESGDVLGSNCEKASRVPPYAWSRLLRTFGEKGK